MRIFEINSSQVSERQTLAPLAMPAGCENAFLWISLTRDELKSNLPEIRDVLQSLCGCRLVDLHVSDLLNEQLPSRYDYTSEYDLLVFRRLVVTPTAPLTPSAQPSNRGDDAPDAPAHKHSRGVPPALRRIDTQPVGFAVFDRVLLSVHPQDTAVRDAFAGKLIATGSAVSATSALDERAISARMPTSPADLMLRVVSHIVDGYLELRRELSRQLEHWQVELIDAKSRFSNWGALMKARQTLRHLGEICEDQCDAIQDWIDELETLSPLAAAEAAWERELVLVRSRDVLEHIERVLHHVRRLEQDAETAVQMHFSIQSHRTNDIMRALTVLTAVFLPLNLIAGIFGMNFDYIPLLHQATGFWITLVSMLGIAVVLVIVFWRKRYLARTIK